MKRSLKTKKIGDLISHFLAAKHNHNSYTKIDYTDLWLKTMGKQVFTETKSIRLQKNILYVSIFNPYLKRDLVFQHDTILARIQELRPDIHKIHFD